MARKLDDVCKYFSYQIHGVQDLRDHIKSSGKFAIFTRLKIGSQTPSPLNF